MVRRRKHRVTFDPVADWDGLVATPLGLWTADQMQANSRLALAAKERSATVRRQDEEAKRTPIGGMQYRAPR